MNNHFNVFCFIDHSYTYIILWCKETNYCYYFFSLDLLAFINPYI
jgi:hypothetical protein